MRICAFSVKTSKKEKIGNIKNCIETEVIKQINSGCLYFMIALCSKADMELAEMLIKIRKKYPQIHIFSIAPNLYYLSGKMQSYKSRIENIISECSAVETIIFTEKSRWIKKADELLIKSSDVIIIFTDCKSNPASRLPIKLAADLYGKKSIVIDV